MDNHWCCFMRTTSNASDHVSDYWQVLDGCCALLSCSPCCKAATPYKVRAILQCCKLLKNHGCGHKEHIHVTSKYSHLSKGHLTSRSCTRDITSPTKGRAPGSVVRQSLMRLRSSCGCASGSGKKMSPLSTASIRLPPASLSTCGNIAGINHRVYHWHANPIQLASSGYAGTTVWDAVPAHQSANDGMHRFTQPAGALCTKQ